MGRTRFHGFTARLGNPRTEGHGTDTLAFVAFGAAERPVAFIGGHLTVEHAGTLVQVDGAYTTRTATSPRTLGITYVVPDEHRRRGYAEWTLRAVLESPAAADVEVFACIIDTANHASVGLIQRVHQFIETPGTQNSRRIFRYDTRKPETNTPCE